MAQTNGPGTAAVDAQHTSAQPGAPDPAAGVRGGAQPGAADGTGGGAAAERAEGVAQGEDRVAELEAALAAAEARAAEHWDKYLRERAEMENYKRRLERTYADQARRAHKDVLLKFLAVADNLERALAYQESGSQQVDPRQLAMGLRMTYDQLKDLLNSEGLKEIKTVGERFDPAVHEAVATEAAAGRAEGEIVGELQKGYLYQDELLRPARVKVATTE